MSNSNLVNYTKLSPNCNKPRNHKIDKITIHHMAGNLTVEQCGNVFSRDTRKASSNYGIGTDGRIGMYVEECNRSWCSSNAENDHRAITIEVANDQIGGDWHVGDKALAKLIDLCVDICRRNGITKLNFTGDKSGNLTMHKWFAATACPGPYLESKFPYIAQEVNKRLSEGVSDTAQDTLYRVRTSWGDSNSQKGAFRDLANAKKCADANAGYSVFDENGKCVYANNRDAASGDIICPFKVEVKITDLCIRKGAGTDYAKTGRCTGKGVFTITEVQSGTGSSLGWGKLKSGAGWISLDYCTKM